MKLRTRRKPAQEAPDSQLSSEETLELDGHDRLDGSENGPEPVTAGGDVAEATLEVPSNGATEAAEIDGVAATDGVADNDGAAASTNGSGNGHTKANGSGAIMLPKRRRRTEPASSLATAPAASVDVEEPPAKVGLPPRRRKAPIITEETVAPEVEVTPATPPVRERRPSVFSPEGGLRIFLTYENLFWAGLFILTIATRFWDLAPRGIHHDESLHAHFSRQLYDGTGYIHDPMMHGPLQFHMIAMMYWLFGTTDATARFASVLCGIFVVMSPFFLRRQMGQVPAMVCAALLFISPSILYFSRMAREDAIFSGMEMIMLVGLWRFVSERKPTDFVIFMAGLALMFTIKETAYLTLLILAGVGLVLFALQAGYAILGALAGYGIGMGVLYFIVNSGMKSGSIPHLPNIPQVSPNFDIIWQFMGAFFAHPLVLGALVLTALFVGAVSMLIRTQRRAAEPLAATGVPVRRHSANGVTVRRANGSSSSASENGHEVSANTVTEERLDEAYDPDLTDDATPLYDPDALRPDRESALGRYQPGSVPHLIGSLFAKPAGYRPLTPNQMLIGAGSIIAVCLVLYGLASFSDQTLGFAPRLLVALGVGVAISGLVWLFMRFRTLMTGVLVFSTIYLTLYTVFFTDIPRGIISGPFGSLGYWMAQHDVVRGDQPWYFYLLLIPLYEPVAVFFSLAAIIFFAWRGGRWLADRIGDRRYGVAESRLGLFNTDRPVPFASFRAFFPLFLIAWLIGTVGIYSWAGEKMPWLMMHMVRPAIFLASLFVGALIVSLIRRRRERIAAEAEYGYDDGYEYEPDEPIRPRPSLPTRRHSPAVQSRQNSSGPMSALRGAFAGGPTLALAGASASGSGTPPQTVAMASGYARRSTRAALPPRRRTQTREPEPEYVIEQDPPWVAWNRPTSLFPFVSYLLMFVILTMAWGLKMNAITYFESGTGYGNWGLTWVFPLIILLATIGYAVWVGPGRALRYLAVGILAVGLMYEFRSAINLSYNNPDVPTEMATYVQTSPHVVSTIRNLDKFADATGATIAYPGGVQQGPKKNIKVMYDSFTSWPMEWYLRDFDKQFIGGGEANPGSDVPVMLLEYAKHNNKENLTRDYQVIRYPMRWWFPEEWYKEQFNPSRWERDAQGNIVTDPTTGKRKEAAPLVQLGGALGTISKTVTEPPLQATLWKYLTFRETPMALGSEDMLLFVRKDVAQTWHRIQYSPPHPSTDVHLRALPEREWWLTDPKTGR